MKYLFFKLFTLSLLIIAVGCEKNPKIGEDVIPDNQKYSVIYSDTSTIVAYSVREDSVGTNGNSTYMLGSAYDPIFGTSTASIFSQFSIRTDDVGFGHSLDFDSIVLCLGYSGSSTGDITKTQTVRVYELSEDMPHVEYYSSEEKDFYPSEIATKIFTPKPTSSVVAGEDTLAPHLRVRLDDVFGSKILNADSLQLRTVDNFVDFFKGLYITCDSGSNSIVQFDFASPLSKIVLYYSHKLSDTSSFSTSYDLIPRVRFNNYEHYNYYNASETCRLQLQGDTALGDSLLYLHSMGGVSLNFSFPYIANFAKDKDIAISKAELIFTINDIDNTLNSPELLEIVSPIIDNNFPKDYIGGNIDSVNGEYRFRLNRYVQERLIGVGDNSLSLKINRRNVITDGVKLYGPKRTTNNLRLEIFYIDLSENN